MPNEITNPTEPIRMTEVDLVRVWEEMVHDLKIILRIESDPAQTIWLKERMEQLKSERISWLDEDMHESRPVKIEPITYSLDELIRSELLAWDNSLNGYSFMRRNYQLTINVDVPEQNVLFNGGQMDIHFVVNVDKPTDHTSQEELLHAAQISLWGTDRIPTYLAGKIDE